jgi:glycerate-2-kinase
MLIDQRAVLLELYAAAIDAAQPGPAVTAALAGAALQRRVHVIAIGKAARAMAAAAVSWVVTTGRELAGGVAVGADDTTPDPAIAGLPFLAGDHPAPGARSARAAAAIGGAAAAVDRRDSVLVLLSGGASSLAAAPVPGVTIEELATLNATLLASGLDIVAMNRVRKRFLRWGAGRLAEALAPAEVRCLIASDVIGDDLAAIGSGPCAPDAATAADVASILQAPPVHGPVPSAILRLLAETTAGRIAETPKPGDAAFAGVHAEIIVRNGIALAGAAERAAALGLSAEVVTHPLTGDAAAAGSLLGRALAGLDPVRCTIRGGETTVALGDTPGRGGRCQELALSAAREMAGRTDVALLAAGTDGRDGPTDAAGAVVDGGSWARITAAGREPALDLSRHDAFPALAAAGALIARRPTGTNVADIVITLG